MDACESVKKSLIQNHQPVTRTTSKQCVHTMKLKPENRGTVDQIVERALQLTSLAVEPIPIYVTAPRMPSLLQYAAMLERIWQTRWLTNHGEYHVALERDLAEYLRIPNVSLTANGTLALLIALRSAGVGGGSVVTTPFTFPATIHCLEWLGATPVFADVDAQTGNLDPRQVSDAIQEDTSAILAVHVYGTPCDHRALSAIAEQHGLKLVYDAAHAFGVEVDGNSILSWGDASATSFHATKLFTTIEGGAVAVSSTDKKREIDLFRNFGIANEETVVGSGINAKMNELEAAFGILTLKEVETEIAQRGKVADIYTFYLSNLQGVTVLTRGGSFRANHAYYAIRIDARYTGISRDAVYAIMRRLNIFTRKYFHPIPPTYSPYAGLPSSSRENLKAAFTLDEQVLCLPIYGSLLPETAERIAQKLRAVVQVGSKLTTPVFTRETRWS
jgi:dTDP-4-amino-4,6-dideoxygalactose transaminase